MQCEWKLIDEEMNCYQTECNNIFYLSDGNLIENKIKHCCFCGKEIKELIR